MTIIVHVNNSYRPRRKSRRSKGKVCSKYKPEFRPRQVQADSPIRQSVPKSDASHESATLSIQFPRHSPRPSYEGEMAKREAAAQVESNRRKKMVAPLYNKGGYQYIGDMPPEIIQGLGRKL